MVYKFIIKVILLSMLAVLTSRGQERQEFEAASIDDKYKPNCLQEYQTYCEYTCKLMTCSEYVKSSAAERMEWKNCITAFDKRPQQKMCRYGKWSPCMCAAPTVYDLDKGVCVHYIYCPSIEDIELNDLEPIEPATHLAPIPASKYSKTSILEESNVYDTTECKKLEETYCNYTCEEFQFCNTFIGMDLRSRHKWLNCVTPIIQNPMNKVCVDPVAGWEFCMCPEYGAQSCNIDYNDCISILGVYQLFNK